MVDKFDVSIILNIHDEVAFVHRTLHSLEAAARYSRAFGLTIELIMVLDRAEPALTRGMSDYRSDAYEKIQVIEVDRGSLGAARNDGIAVARGRYINTADADDLVSYNIINNMYSSAVHAGDNVIIIPEYHLNFGKQSFVQKLFCLNKITPLVFLQYHPYGSKIFLKRSIFSQLNYEDISVSGCYAYEDWHFNATAIAKGYDFITAPQTVLFYRKRLNSLSSFFRNRSNNLIPPNILFDPNIYRVVCADHAALLENFEESNFNDYFYRDLILQETSSFLRSEIYHNIVLEANRIEPAISVDAYRPSHLELPRTDAVITGLLYLDLCRRIGGNIITDVFLLPSLKPGGSELYLIQVMNAIAEIDPCSKILVISFENLSEESWISKLPQNAIFINLNSINSSINIEQSLLILHKLIQNIYYKIRIHINLSSFMIEFFSKGLASAFKNKFVIFYRFCDIRVILDDKIIMCPNKFNFISENLKYINLIITDHQKLIYDDHFRIGYDLEKWVCLPAYCEINHSKVGQATTHINRKGRFLWASRLVGQKFPEMLVFISLLLSKDIPDVVIDIYGGSYGAVDAVDPEIFMGCSNLNYCGPYNNFEEIDLSRYDGFIYTTLFDGLPNVILQAMSAGLPVIAPECDGIPEVVRHGVTGFLTPYSADTAHVAQSYCNHIRTLSFDDDRRVVLSRQSREFIAKYRSRAQHRRRVGEILGLEPESE